MCHIYGASSLAEIVCNHERLPRNPSPLQPPTHPMLHIFGRHTHRTKSYSIQATLCHVRRSKPVTDSIADWKVITKSRAKEMHYCSGRARTGQATSFEHQFPVLQEEAAALTVSHQVVVFRPKTDFNPGKNLLICNYFGIMSKVYLSA